MRQVQPEMLLKNSNLPVYKISSLKITPPKTPNSGQFSYPLPNIASAQYQYNVSEWSGMFTYGSMFQWTRGLEIQLRMLVWYKAEIIITSSNVASSCHDIAGKFLTL
jgi:hypothetical protein